MMPDILEAKCYHLSAAPLSPMSAVAGDGDNLGERFEISRSP